MIVLLYLLIVGNILGCIYSLEFKAGLKFRRRALRFPILIRLYAIVEGRLENPEIRSVVYKIWRVNFVFAEMRMHFFIVGHDMVGVDTTSSKRKGLNVVWNILVFVLMKKV